MVGDKTLDRSFQTASNTTRLVVNFNQLSGDKKYSIVIRGKTIKGLGEPSKDNVIIETPAMGECKVKEQNKKTASMLSNFHTFLGVLKRAFYLYLYFYFYL